MRWRGLAEDCVPRLRLARDSSLHWNTFTTLLSLPRPFHSFTPVLVMFRRRTVYIFLSLLAAVLIGTVVVLSSISYYLSISVKAYITEAELGVPYNTSVPWNATEHGDVERIPRILHQTWKTEVLPEKWADVSQGCRDLMPD